MKTRSRAAALAACLSLATLLVGGLMPWWTAYVHDGKGRYPSVSLWAGVPLIFTNEGLSASMRKENMVIAGILVGVAAMMGVAAYWIAAPRRRAESAADYAEVDGQPVPDGHTDRPAG